MIRITASPRSVKRTASSRFHDDLPNRRSRRSSVECSLSSWNQPSGSPKTVVASLNLTPCFLRFAAALAGSHSNVSAIAQTYNPRGLIRITNNSTDPDIIPRGTIKVSIETYYMGVGLTSESFWVDFLHGAFAKSTIFDSG